LDPQERKFLEVCWEAIEDAGHTPASLNASADEGCCNRVGVFVGVMHKDHALVGLEALPSETDRAKARGMVARNAIVVLGGMAEKELHALRRITPMSEGEAALVTSWAEVVESRPVEREDELAALDGRHVYERQVLLDRLAGRYGKTLYVLEVKIHIIEPPLDLPMLDVYGGCRSWVALRM